MSAPRRTLLADAENELEALRASLAAHDAALRACVVAMQNADGNDGPFHIAWRKALAAAEAALGGKS